MPTNYLTASIRQSLSGSNPNMPATITNADLLKLLNAIEVAQNAGVGDILADGSVPFVGQETFGAGLKTDTIAPSGTSLVSFASMLGLKPYTTAQEGALVPAEGSVYYNTDLDVIRSYDGAAWQTVGGGLPVTGSTEGATVSSQPLNKGATIGKASTDDGVITMKNSAGSATVLISSTAAKALKITNAGADANVGINGDGETGFGLKVTGEIKSTANVNTPYLSNVAGDVQLDMNTPNALTITASGGTSVSAGLNISGATGAGAVDNAFLKIAQHTNASAAINFATANDSLDVPNPGDIYNRADRLRFINSGSVEETFAFTSDIPTGGQRLIASATGLSGQDASDVDLTFESGCSLSTHSPTIVIFKYGSGTMGTLSLRISANSGANQLCAQAMAGVTSTVNNLVSPLTGVIDSTDNISVIKSVTSAGASTFDVYVYGIEKP